MSSLILYATMYFNMNRIKKIAILIVFSIYGPLDPILIDADAQILARQQSLSNHKINLQIAIDNNNRDEIALHHGLLFNAIQQLAAPVQTVARLIRNPIAAEDEPALHEVRNHLAGARAALRAAGGVMAQIPNTQGGAQMAAQALTEQAPPGITPRQQ